VTARRRVGVFGGTFDPIHIGHLAAAQDVAHRLALDRVLFVPNRRPPHKTGQRVSEVAERVEMVRLAVADNPLFELSLVEVERSGLSYTLNTLRELRSSLGVHSELYFLVGCDALSTLHSWHRPETILEEFRIIVMDRPTGTRVDWGELETRFPHIRRQVDVVHVVQLEISSRDIRERAETGAPIRYYVVPRVERYILERGLYRTQSARPQ
jgi:nicotinate-nucleotide adenylyltransferase